ncbi:MAG: hypothetical protein ABJN69_03040 [Hellea sp.]
MSDEIFGIAKGVDSPESEELLKFSQNIDWDYVAKKLAEGTIDDKVAIAIVSDSVPAEYNGLDLKALYKAAYPNHMKLLMRTVNLND